MSGLSRNLNVQRCNKSKTYYLLLLKFEDKSINIKYHKVKKKI